MPPPTNPTQQTPILCAHPPSNPPATLYDKPLPLTIGRSPRQKTFHIYRGLLCHHSRYFDRLLNGSFAEGGSSSLCLTHVSVATFQVFYNWVYTGVVDCAGALFALADVDVDTITPLLILSAYNFSIYHIIPVFANALVDAFYTHTMHTQRLHACLIPVLYRSTADGDAMRRLFVDLWVESRGAEGVGKKELEGLEGQFVVDWVVGCRERGVVLGERGDRDRLRVGGGGVCARYHWHG